MVIPGVLPGMGFPTIHVQLREGQEDPPGLDRFDKVRRLPTKDWPLIVVFGSGPEQLRLRDETLHSWAGLGYEVLADQTIDIPHSGNPNEY